VGPNSLIGSFQQVGKASDACIMKGWIRFDGHNNTNHTTTDPPKNDGTNPTDAHRCNATNPTVNAPNGTCTFNATSETCNCTFKDATGGSITVNSAAIPNTAGGRTLLFSHDQTTSTDYTTPAAACAAAADCVWKTETKVRLYTLNPVVAHSLKEPGFNP
jgi:hypothetical protein